MAVSLRAAYKINKGLKPTIITETPYEDSGSDDKLFNTADRFNKYSPMPAQTMATEFEEDKQESEDINHYLKQQELKRKGYLTRQAIVNNLFRRLNKNIPESEVSDMMLDKKALKRLQKQAFHQI